MQNELNELRHQVRTLKRVVYGACGLLLVGGLLAATSLQSVPDVVKAKSFQVVNDEGKSVVVLLSFKGSGAIVSKDKNDAVTFVVINETDEEGLSQGTLSTKNGKGQTLVKLGVTMDGEGVVQTQNGKGGTLVELGVTTGGYGAVTTENGKGGELVTLGVTTGGSGSVTTENGKGQTLVKLGVTMGGKGLVETQNGKGTITSQSP